MAVPQRNRGQRIQEIREAGSWDQRTFADLLNEAARRLGFAPIYDIVKLSKIENGRRDVSLDDAIVAAEIDPLNRGIGWVAGAALQKTA